MLHSAAAWRTVYVQGTTLYSIESCYAWQLVRQMLSVMLCRTVSSGSETATTLHLDISVKKSVIVEAACTQRQEVLCRPGGLQECGCHQEERGSY